MIKVLVADDSMIIRKSLKTLIEQDKEISVIGSASNGAEALEKCKELAPDLVLMDIRMPVCDGVEGTRLIKEYNGETKVVILTTFDDSELVAKALKNGADSYVLKDIGDDDLIMIIKSTMNGFGIFQNNVVYSIKEAYNSANSPTGKSFPDNGDYLTPREKEIVRMIVDGKSNKEISSALGIVEGSVRNMVSNILRKLKLGDRTQLALYAVYKNLV